MSTSFSKARSATPLLVVRVQVSELDVVEEWALDAPETRTLIQTCRHINEV